MESDGFPAHGAAAAVTENKKTTPNARTVCFMNSLDRDEMDDAREDSPVNASELMITDASEPALV